MPNLSIIIPVYNAEKTILNTLNSISKSTYSDYEIICVDDGSTDKSCEIIERFILGNVAKIKLIKTMMRGGYHTLGILE